MSTVATCPVCNSKAAVKEKDGAITYKAIQDEDALKKIGQLKKAMEKFKTRAEELEKELQDLKLKQ